MVDISKQYLADFMALCPLELGETITNFWLGTSKIFCTYKSKSFTGITGGNITSDNLFYSKPSYFSSLFQLTVYPTYILNIFFQPEQRVKLEYESMFETGVDEYSWDDTVS